MAVVETGPPATLSAPVRTLPGTMFVVQHATHTDWRFGHPETRLIEECGCLCKCYTKTDPPVGTGLLKGNRLPTDFQFSILTTVALHTLCNLCAAIHEAWHKGDVAEGVIKAQECVAQGGRRWP